METTKTLNLLSPSLAILPAGEAWELVQGENSSLSDAPRSEQ